MTDQQLERLEKIVAACPVRRSIETGIKFSEHVVRDRSTVRFDGGEPRACSGVTPSSART